MARNNRLNEHEFLMELGEKLKEVSRAPNIKKYKPHAKQATFHGSQKKKKLYIGGNRSGKTTGGVTEAIWRATCKHPYRPDLNALGPNRGRVIGVDFVNGVEKIIFPQYQQWLYPSALRGGAWNTAYDSFTRTLNFSNGSFIEFMSYDQPLVKFAGTSRHWIHFDEEPPHTIFVENLARLIDTDGDYWITMTPVEGITWVYDELYEPNITKDDPPVLIIEINSMENPYLSTKAIESFLDGVDEDEVTARIQGKFVQVGGRVYKNFDPVVGGLHVLDEPPDLSTMRDWFWVMMLDHGFNNPTAVEWFAVDPNGFIIVFDEHYKREWTVDQHAAFIKSRWKQHGKVPDLLIADPSIRGRNGATGTSIHQEYQKYGIVFVDGVNDVKSGIIRVKKYLNNHKYIGKTTHPLMQVGTDGEPFPMLRISPVCGNLIHEMKRYRWKTYTNKKLQYENNAYDEPHKKDDHACDALRYGIMSQPDLFADNPNLSGFKERVDDAMMQLGDPGLFRPVGAVDPDTDEIADPHGLRETNWSEYNNIPTRFSDGWEFDEHMGGIV